MGDSSRLWKTTLTGLGSTPAKALAMLLEDSLAEHIKSAIYINPKRPATIESLSEGESAEIIAWEATVTVSQRGALHV
jgi:hypothetical protein